MNYVVFVLTLFAPILILLFGALISGVLAILLSCFVLVLGKGLEKKPQIWLAGGPWWIRYVSSYGLWIVLGIYNLRQGIQPSYGCGMELFGGVVLILFFVGTIFGAKISSVLIARYAERRLTV